jgi:hypothetical protein
MSLAMNHVILQPYYEEETGTEETGTEETGTVSDSFSSSSPGRKNSLHESDILSSLPPEPPSRSGAPSTSAGPTMDSLMSSAASFNRDFLKQDTYDTSFQHLYRAFHALDHDGNGVADARELTACLLSYAPPAPRHH